MEQTIKGTWLAETYWSMGEIIDTAIKRDRDAAAYINQRGDDDFMGEVGSWDRCLELARKGWTDQLPGALDLAESAVQTADQEHILETFQPVWDVSGAEVDVARYLAGEPENMIDFPPSQTSKVGRVITLVVGVGVNGGVSGQEIIDRGRKIVALALALNRLGHAVEIWADDTQRGTTKQSRKLFQRILVKGTNDEIDPAVLLFALAHPAFQRGIKWATWDGLPAAWTGFGANDCRAITRMDRTPDEIALYPEGSIFIPSTQSTVMSLSPERFLEKYLGELGLLAE